MLVYDVTHEKSFDNIRNWIRNIEEVSKAILLSQYVCVVYVCMYVCMYVTYVFMYVCMS